MPSMLVLKSSRVAAHWNNEATLLIQQRDYAKAAATLTTALITLKEALHTNTTASSISSSSPSSIRIAPTSTTSSRSNTTPSSYSFSEPVEEEIDVMMDTVASSSSSLSRTSCLLKFLSTDKPEQEPQAMFDNRSSSSSSLNTTTAPSSSLQQPRMIAIPVEDDGMFFYHAPLKVTSSEALVSSPLCVEILSYAIIYNLGLCHHLQALLVQAGASRSTTTVSTSSLSFRTMQLERAVSFYQHAQRLASAHSWNGYRDILIIPLLVLVNNMGHAYYCLNKESSIMAKHCFEQLWIALLEYQKTSSSSSWSMTQDQEHLQQNTTLDFPEQYRLVECFLSNILQFLILGVETHVAAPAA